MMAGSDSNAVAGGPARHVPVLARAVAEYLNAHDGGIYIDGTFGAGGHTRGILSVPGTRVIGIDRDQSAVAGGFGLVEEAAGRLVLVEDRFSNLDAVAQSQGHEAVDGVGSFDRLDVIGDRQLAEPFAERAEAGDVELLVAEEDAQVVGEGPLDLGEGLVVEGGEVRAFDLRAQGAGDRLHLDAPVIRNFLH